MFFYELFIGLPVGATLNQELLSIYVKKAKWQTELTGRLADRFGKRPQNPLLRGVIGAISLPNDFLNTVFGRGS